MVQPSPSTVNSKQRILSLLSKSPAAIRQSFGLMHQRDSARDSADPGNTMRAAGRKLFQESRDATNRSSAILQKLSLSHNKGLGRRAPEPTGENSPTSPSKSARSAKSSPTKSSPTKSSPSKPVIPKLNLKGADTAKPSGRPSSRAGMDTQRSRALQHTARRQGRIMRQRLKYIALTRAQSAVNGRLECRAALDMVEVCKEKLEQMAACTIQSTWRRHKAKRRYQQKQRMYIEPKGSARRGGAARFSEGNGWLQVQTPRTAREAARSCEGRIAKERLKYLASCRTQVAVRELGFLGKKAAEEMVQSCKHKLELLCASCIQATWRGFATRRRLKGQPVGITVSPLKLNKQRSEQVHSQMLGELKQLHQRTGAVAPIETSVADGVGKGTGTGLGGIGNGAGTGEGSDKGSGSAGGTSKGKGSTGGTGDGSGKGSGSAGGTGNDIGTGNGSGKGFGSGGSDGSLMNASHYATEMKEIDRQIQGIDNALSSIQVTDAEMKDIMKRRKLDLERKKKEAEAKAKAAAAEAARKKAEAARKEAEIKREAELLKQGKGSRVAPPSNVPAPPPLLARGAKGAKGAKGVKGKGKGKGPPARGKGVTTVPSGRWALPEISDTQNTVWGSAAGVVLDDSISGGLMGLFTKKPQDPAAKSSNKEEKKKVSSVIDNQRAHRGGILLAQFRDNFDKIRLALLTADTEYLTLDRVNSLLEIVPSEEEILRCCSYKKTEGERLVEVVKYFQIIGDIPRIEQRLNMLKMKHTFSHAISQLKQNMCRHISVCEQLTTNQAFCRVLEVALELGNTFNGQKACGTQFSALVNFLGMKASGNSKITLLHYLASVLSSKMPELYNFHKEIEQVFFNGRAVVTENLLEIETRDLSAQIMLANSELQEYGEDTGVEGDSFYSVIRGFCSESAAEMEEIQNMFETMSQRAYATTSYFGESALSSEKLFEMIQKFVARYKEAQSEHGWLIKNNMLPAP